VFHSNYGPILHRFRDTMTYCLKNANFWYHTSIWVTPSEFRSQVSCGKLRMMGLPGDEKSLTVSLAVSIQYTNVTDRRTPHDSKDCAMHSFVRWKPFSITSAILAQFTCKSNKIHTFRSSLALKVVWMSPQYFYVLAHVNKPDKITEISLGYLQWFRLCPWEQL